MKFTLTFLFVIKPSDKDQLFEKQNLYYFNFFTVNVHIYIYIYIARIPCLPRAKVTASYLYPIESNNGQSWSGLQACVPDNSPFLVWPTVCRNAYQTTLYSWSGLQSAGMRTRQLSIHGLAYSLQACVLDKSLLLSQSESLFYKGKKGKNILHHWRLCDQITIIFTKRWSLYPRYLPNAQGYGRVSPCLSV